MSQPCRIKDPMVNHMQLSSLKRFSRWSGFLLHGWGLYHSYGVNLNWSTLDNSLILFSVDASAFYHGSFAIYVRRLTASTEQKKKTERNASQVSVYVCSFPSFALILYVCIYVTFIRITGLTRARLRNHVDREIRVSMYLRERYSRVTVN